ILKQPKHPAVMLLFMMHTGGGNAQEWLSKVGAHYALPMVSFRDALWPEMQAGRLKWDTVMADEVHPNDAGHAIAASLVTHALAQAMKPAASAPPVVVPLPAPLFTDLFEHVALYEAGSLDPVQNQGWTLEDFGGGKC